MPESYVHDIADPRLAAYRDLPNSQVAERCGQFVVEGWLLVERLIASRFPVESILIESQRLAEFGARLPSTVEVLVTRPGLVEQIIGFNFHRGILACGRRLPAPALEEIVGVHVATSPGGVSPDRESLVVACEDIQDPTNLGTILRNCAAFGVDGVLLSDRCADAFSRRVVRVSMGASLRIPIRRAENWASELEQLKRSHGLRLIATVLDDAAERLDRVTRPHRFALLFGNEGHGLTRDTIALCDQCVTLPMAHNTDSLNAAVATGVFLYQFRYGIGEK